MCLYVISRSAMAAPIGRGERRQGGCSMSVSVNVRETSYLHDAQSGAARDHDSAPTLSVILESMSVKTNLLAESLLLIIRRNPCFLLRIPLLLLQATCSWPRENEQITNLVLNPQFFSELLR